VKLIARKIPLSMFFLKLVIYIYKGKGKGKAIPLQASTGPEGSRMLRLPDFKKIGT
jgi:hypothetical protein